MLAVTRWTLIVVFLFNSNLASAYIGPGAGLSAIGSVLALIGAMVLMIVGFLWYPIKRVMRKYKTKAVDQQHTQKRQQR